MGGVRLRVSSASAAAAGEGGRGKQAFVTTCWCVRRLQCVCPRLPARAARFAAPSVALWTATKAQVPQVRVREGAAVAVLVVVACMSVRAAVVRRSGAVVIRAAIGCRSGCPPPPSRAAALLGIALVGVCSSQLPPALLLPLCQDAGQRSRALPLAVSFR